MLAIPIQHTQPQPRAEISRSHESSGTLASRYGVSIETRLAIVERQEIRAPSRKLQLIALAASRSRHAMTVEVMLSPLRPVAQRRRD